MNAQRTVRGNVAQGGYVMCHKLNLDAARFAQPTARDDLHGQINTAAVNPYDIRAPDVYTFRGGQGHGGGHISILRPVTAEHK